MKPRIAIVHDYIKEYGGAERVLEALHELYPDATVFTSVYIPRFLGPHRKRFKSWHIRTSFLQYAPFKEKLISIFRLVSPLAFSSFDFSGYDIIITSATGAYFPNTLKKKNAMLVCYCHTPPRYLYGYMTARQWKKNKVVMALAMIANHILRMVDFAASRNVDYYVANSQEVAGRIKKFYRADSVVIYPPVTIPEKVGKLGKKEYFVTGGRLARAKHVDLILQACQTEDMPLKIFGKSFAGYGKELIDLVVKGSKVEFVGEVTDEEKFELISHAKAFLFASEDEDFGIIPVEAMAVGVPVIAYFSGGVKETVIEGKTGTFFKELSVAGISEAISRFKKMKFDEKTIRRHAVRFSKERFLNELSSFIDTTFSSRPPSK